jgi:tRNA pseudouridine32 synthase/23S rRNA pseudouridine746 synthase
MRKKGSFFVQGEKALTAINKKIESLEANPRLAMLKQKVAAKKQEMQEALQEEKASMRKAKQLRKERRTEGERSLSSDDFLALKKELEKESHTRQYLYKELLKSHSESLEMYEEALKALTAPIASLKAKRKQKSAKLQQKIFDQYQFLNQHKETKGLSEIFAHTGMPQPPSGAGDCAAPRLLQYAFAHDLELIAMAEFWWGISPPKEVRRHKHYYPACRGRCKPILAHMLEGIDMEEDPFAKSPKYEGGLTIVHEDDSLLLINKPPEFLTVPGKEISDSIYTRVQALYPKATGPLMVHRLDMSTSGLLLIAKSKKIHKLLQQQFINRTVKKRYTAVLEGLVEADEGEINLPLRVDLDDRPRQLVCYEHGKPAKTRWRVVERHEGKTRIHFFPITGRTHQLRVHAAHPSGLDSPIVGDDLYGKKDSRLHLHADLIEFMHPLTQERLRFQVDADF